MRKKIFTSEMKKMVCVMIEQGYSVRAIATRIGVTEKSLRTLCSKNGIKLREGTKISAAVSVPCYHMLIEEADRRHLTVSQVVVMVLEVVAKDQLFKALDIGTPERGI